MPWALAAAHALAGSPLPAREGTGGTCSVPPRAIASRQKAYKMENRAEPSLGQQLSGEVARTAGEGQPGWAPGAPRPSVEATDSETPCGSFPRLAARVTSPPPANPGDAGCDTQEGRSIPSASLRRRLI